jgi:hypothetical protein
VAGEPTIPVWVVSHGWHTGLAVPARNVPCQLRPEPDRDPPAEYVEVGWGERDFYQARDPTSGLAVRAAVWPSASTLHVATFDRPPTAAFPRAEIVDRIAVSVANRVITQSDLERQIRVTAFQNDKNPNFSSANKRVVAEKMIEQKLIQRELENSRYPVPSPEELAHRDALRNPVELGVDVGGVGGARPVELDEGVEVGRLCRPDRHGRRCHGLVSRFSIARS